MTLKSDWQKTVLTDMKVEIEMPVRIYERYGTPEYWARLERALDQEISDATDFIRDRRSRDHYQMNIVRVEELTCVFCGYSYGVVSSPDDLTPVCCERAMASYKWIHGG